ncbi:uncharacterized protein N7446_009254 [Penicillium canescens]|uniref:Uncharacterized protein n=1 Tax=Penicillium canescens TaxID=5083 RepID=A0AAD6I662_PENCN|nr:uncharacterized protein N7446_009254 [Penicillium canescens]KAJ6034504.1 hypothetical protein N7460_008679 [Penicillium canescens]KAJ6046164.1 hypothetical protein N7444_007418 [Penicillium canescens]KAJ6053242.1 hypothetical protein N7446_009254 [Penicillium canescens]
MEALLSAVKEVKRADILEHIEVNVFSVISLYQATRPLLEKRQPPVPSAGYGASKSLLPWYSIRIDSEEVWLDAFVLNPGWVQTDMGNSGAKFYGFEWAPDTIEKSTAAWLM